ncbi:MAG: M28 family peptidase [Gemmatimonadaceae bacterium]
MTRWARFGGGATAVITLLSCAPATVPSREASPPSGLVPPALESVAQSDIQRDLFALASDSFRGREAGTLDELRASVWLADRAREAGLLPAGDDGTYFQFWPMRRIRISRDSRIRVGERVLALDTEVVVTSPVAAKLDLPLVFVGEGREGDLGGVDIRGKAVAAVISRPANPPSGFVSLRPFRYTLTAIRERVAFLTGRGASAVLLVSDSVADSAWVFAGTTLGRGRYNIDSTGTDQLPTQPPVLWLHSRMLETIRSASGSQRFVADVQVESFLYPSVNVVALVAGTDQTLRSEYVLYSGHQDHDGVRVAIAGDSIWNGADDNATVSVALLAIGRAFAKQPGRRSALFVWHGAEERGLLGSRWFVNQPTVPRAAIVAVLNGDMIGRNHPDSATLMGSQPPHRNSNALVRMALEANEKVGRFSLDSSWDRPEHPEGWYFRSDHLPYARAGIPALFFSTLLHPEYHTPRDEAATIDVAKLTRMARWMYATGWSVSNASSRPQIDEGFKLER